MTEEQVRFSTTGRAALIRRVREESLSTHPERAAADVGR